MKVKKLSLSILGDFKYDKKNGQGRMINSVYTMYEGEWKNGEYIDNKVTKNAVTQEQYEQLGKLSLYKQYFNIVKNMNKEKIKIKVCIFKQIKNLQT